MPHRLSVKQVSAGQVGLVGRGGLRRAAPSDFLLPLQPAWRPT